MKGVREVRRHVAEADDTKILQIVRMIDALENRGDSDALLAPVRPRLAAMNASRPLRFSRLLFTPADPLIVPREAWRPGMPCVPRVALPILANFVRNAMGGADATTADRQALAGTDALISGATTAEADIARAAGSLCWPHAAAALRRVGPSTSMATCAAAWREAGLPAQTLEPIAMGLAAVIETALLLDPLGWSAGAPDAAQLTEKLAETEAPGMQAWGMLLCLLLIRLPEYVGDLLAAPRRCRMQGEVAEAAAEFALAWATPPTKLAACALTHEEAANLGSRATVLETLALAPGDPGRRRRATAARADLRDASWRRFAGALQSEIVAPLSNLPTDRPASSACVDALESAARRLRAYAMNAGKLGGAPSTEDIRQHVEGQLRDAAGLSPMDRARMLELLGDTQTALASLAAPTARSPHGSRPLLDQPPPRP
jgi:hypothetical protein